MANTMFERYGMSVNEFMRQRLSWFLKMRGTEKPQQVYFIDEVC